MHAHVWEPQLQELIFNILHTLAVFRVTNLLLFLTLLFLLTFLLKPRCKTSVSSFPFLSSPAFPKSSTPANIHLQVPEHGLNMSSFSVSKWFHCSLFALIPTAFYFFCNALLKPSSSRWLESVPYSQEFSYIQHPTLKDRVQKPLPEGFQSSLIYRYFPLAELHKISTSFDL